jgi:hypothetical protein
MDPTVSRSVAGGKGACLCMSAEAGTTSEGGAERAVA